MGFLFCFYSRYAWLTFSLMKGVMPMGQFVRDHIKAIIIAVVLFTITFGLYYLLKKKCD